MNSILKYRNTKCSTYERCTVGRDLAALHPVLGVWMEAAHTAQSSWQFTETDVTRIKTSFMRHKALVALKECGIVSHINYE